MNTIDIRVTGEGEPLLVLHGWGMNSTIWSPIKQQLESCFNVTWVDLPGHGQNHSVKADNLDEMVANILPLMANASHLVGWSLGGLIAQRLAYLNADRVKSLTLIASTPAFVIADNWQHAVPETVLNQFAAHLEDDYVATLKRFLSLQFMGVKGIQPSIKKLRDDIIQSPPAMEALRVGLQILKNTDLRQQQSNHRTLWILGALDKLVPVLVADQLIANGSENNKVRIIDAAGHAPFVSHPDSVSKEIIEFIQNG